MLLKDRVAVIYGAGGSIGSAVAAAFAREGATLFLTGHNSASLERVASELEPAGTPADISEVDALDENAIDKHLKSVLTKAGRVDISFNAVSVDNATIIGIPLVDLDQEAFSLPISTYTKTYFLTARAAAKHMIPKRSGVIMTVSALPARIGSPLNGGYGAAMAARDQLTRDLSLELAPQGIRVIGLRPHGIPASNTMREVFAVKGEPAGATWEQFQAALASSAHTRRVMSINELANAAAFAASDGASAMTGMTLNLTMGAVPD